MIQNLEGYLGCFLEDGQPWAPPAGWELVTMLNITEPASAATGGGEGGGDTVDLPFAAVVLNKASGQLAVIVRGTMTANEWLKDFSYNQTTAVPQFDAPVHWGFATVFEALWPDVQAALVELVAGPEPQATQVSPLTCSPWCWATCGPLPAIP